MSACLERIKNENLTMDIRAASKELVKEIQEVLAREGLYKEKLDGIAGTNTLIALANFKEARWLENPGIVGKSTAIALLEEKHEISEQKPKEESVSILDAGLLGSRSGKSMTLPDGTVVFANQLIRPGVPLTWGEFTKNCTRVPETNQIVENAIRLAIGFGEIRDKWGSAIALTSGYRPPSVNRAIGGASRSRHMQGDAADIYPASGDINKLLQVVRSSSVVGIGLGMRKGFIHIDYRPGDRVVFSY